jgi:uncharacterized protein YyaL (SSP411 family)
LQAPPPDELDAITERLVDAVAGDQPNSADCTRFLLRQYLGTERDDLRDALGVGLAQALTQAAGEVTVVGRAGWLTLFVEAAAIADDERILEAIGELLTALRAQCRTLRAVSEASACVDACLRASSLFDAAEIVPDAIDQLERVIGAAYQPGEGVPGGPPDQVRAASALITAYEITGRLPYSMLAEELMQIARRSAAAESDLVFHCETARVLCRLAALHDDADYRGAAVIAEAADYKSDAARILTAQSARALNASPDEAAIYGLALRDFMALR